MPCRDFDSDSPSRNDTFTIKQQKKRLDEYAAMLCEQCKIIEALDDDDAFAPKVKDWWTKHKVEDARRREEARIKAAARAAAERKKAEEEHQKKLVLFNRLKEELGL